MNRLGIKSNQIISVLDPGIPFEQFIYFSRFNKKFVTHYKFGWASCFLLDDFEERVNHLKKIELKVIVEEVYLSLHFVIMKLIILRNL